LIHLYYKTFTCYKPFQQKNPILPCFLLLLACAQCCYSSEAVSSPHDVIFSRPPQVTQWEHYVNRWTRGLARIGTLDQWRRATGKVLSHEGAMHVATVEYPCSVYRSLFGKDIDEKQRDQLACSLLINGFRIFKNTTFINAYPENVTPSFPFFTISIIEEGLKNLYDLVYELSGLSWKEIPQCDFEKRQFLKTLNTLPQTLSELKQYYGMWIHGYLKHLRYQAMMGGSRGFLQSLPLNQYFTFYRDDSGRLDSDLRETYPIASSHYDEKMLGQVNGLVEECRRMLKTYNQSPPRTYCLDTAKIPREIQNSYISIWNAWNLWFHINLYRANQYSAALEESLQEVYTLRNGTAQTFVTITQRHVAALQKIINTPNLDLYATDDPTGPFAIIQHAEKELAAISTWQSEFLKKLS